MQRRNFQCFSQGLITLRITNLRDEGGPCLWKPNIQKVSLEHLIFMEWYWKLYKSFSDRRSTIFLMVPNSLLLKFYSRWAQQKCHLWLIDNEMKSHLMIISVNMKTPYYEHTHLLKIKDKRIGNKNCSELTTSPDPCSEVMVHHNCLRLYWCECPASPSYPTPFLLASGVIEQAWDTGQAV